MAFNLENMTIDYKKMLRMIPSDRTTLAQSGAVSDLISSLTPGQLVNLFPRYYRDKLPDIGEAVGSIGGALSGGSRLTSNASKFTGGGSGGGGGGGFSSDTSRTRPPPKPAQELAVNKILKENNIIPKTPRNAQGLNKIIPGISKDPDLVSAINEQAQRFGVTPASIAMVLRVENPTLNPAISGGASNRFSGLFQIGAGELKSIGFTPEQFRSLSAAEQTRVWGNWLESINFNKRTNLQPGDTNQNFTMLMANQLGSGRDLKDFNENALLAEGSKQSGEIGGNAVTLSTLAQFAQNINPDNVVDVETSEEEIKETEKIKSELVPLTDDIREKLDSKTLEIYDKASPEQKWNIEHAIGAVGVDKFNEQIKTITKTQANVNETASAIADIGNTPKFVSEKDPRQLYRSNIAVAADDDIWNHVHPDLARDRDRIYAGGDKIRTGAILAADAAFRYAATKGVPMRIAIEGGVDSHSENHLYNGVGEALDFKPGTRDAKGRDVGESNTWKQYGLDPLEIANVSVAAIQGLPGGVARIGVVGSDSSSGTHAQDTGNEGLGIHEQYGGMSWSYGSDPYGAEGGQLRQDVQSGKIGNEHKELVNSLYEPEEATQTASPQSSQRTMVISMGTNDWADPSKTYDNTAAAIKAAQAKGYKVVIVPPINAKVGETDITGASAEVRRAALEAGVDLEEVQDWSGTGGYHPSNEEAKRIAAKYPGQTFVGDSIANQIGTFAENGTKVATDGINTNTILENINSDQVAAPEPALIQAGFSDPVTAAQSNVVPAEPEQPQAATSPSLSPVQIPPPSVNSFSTGGTVPMTPGENIAGVNTTTGKVEFMSNDRELYTKDDEGNLRIDPSTIRQEDQKAQIASAEPQRTESTNQPMQYRPQQPMPVSTPDPNFLETMSSGSMASSPSQLRALNRAKLYSENSSSLVNGHFS